MSSDAARAIWEPLPSEIAGARITHFREALIATGALPSTATDAHALQRWSVEHPDAFWAAVWQAANIQADGPGTPASPWEAVLQNGQSMRPPHATPNQWDGPRWFPGTRLNFAEHLLRRRDDALAIRLRSLLRVDLQSKESGHGIDRRDRVADGLTEYLRNIGSRISADEQHALA